MPTLIEETIDLEDKNLFRSKKLWKPVFARGVFGGNTIGLALNAATKTVDSQFVVHSLHCYFLLAGDDTLPIVFKVHDVRTGKSYASRSVIATQRGKNIFTMMVSFCVPEISRLEYQIKMPKVPSPDMLESDENRLRSLLDDPRAAKWHNSIKLRLNQPLSVETKRVPPKYFMTQESEKNKHMIWMRVKGTLPSIPAVHQCAAAYCSDHELLNSALVPFDLARPSEKRAKTIKMMASLDHTIWFHESFEADEWLLYEMESPRSQHGRGFATAKVWTTDGRLVFSTAQEGVIRVADLPDYPISSKL